MFCPKCGNNLPDGAGFCGKCGSKIENAAASHDNAASASSPVAKAAAGVTLGASSLKLSPVGIAAVIIAIVAFLFTLAPWFEVSSTMSAATNVANSVASGVSAFLGGGSASTGSMSLDDSYTVWGLIGLSNSVSNIAQTYASIGGSRLAGAAAMASLFSWACLLLWIVSLALTVWGSITAFMKGNVGIVRTASIFMMITVFVFYIFAGAMGSDAGVANMLPMLCLILSIVALVCSFSAKKKEA